MDRDANGRVLIKGEGIAALTAAHILCESGLNVSIQQEGFSQRPILMLPENTRWLLTDSWKLETNFWDKTCPVLSKRVVSATGYVDEFPYTASVVSQNYLQRTLKERLKYRFSSIHWLAADIIPESSGYNWVINSIAQQQSAYYHFGSRSVTSFLFTYQEISNGNNYCQMMQTEDAWFFLFPVNSQTGCLQIMHLPGADQNWETVLKIVEGKIGPGLIAEQAGSKVVFSAYPRVIKKLFDKNEIAIGQSMARYDPIGGDGTGNAIRSAVWASQIIIKSFEKQDVTGLLRSYKIAISKHFNEHLGVCAEFYKDCKGWDNELILK